MSSYERVPSQGAAAPAEFPSVGAASATFLQALADHDAAGVDAAAAWLDARATPADIARALAPYALPALAAAGHANIYIGLLGRATRAGGVIPMLRPVAGALVSDPAEPIVVPAGRHDKTATARLVRILASRAGGEPGGLSFIAPLVHEAARRGVLDALCEPEGIFVAPAAAPVQLLRVAAQAMLQGPPGYAAYGWTHCLTLAQGALRAGGWAGQVRTGAYMAAAYIAAHVATYAGQPLDLQYEPEPTRLGLEQALRDTPARAAGGGVARPQARRERPGHRRCGQPRRPPSQVHPGLSGGGRRRSVSRPSLYGRGRLPQCLVGSPPRRQRPPVTAPPDTACLVNGE